MLPLANILLERVIVKDFRIIDIVQQHVGHAQQVRELLLLDAVDRSCIEFTIGWSLNLGVENLEGARQKAARATREVSHSLAELGRKCLGHKVSHRSGRVKLAGITRGL